MKKPLKKVFDLFKTISPSETIHFKRSHHSIGDELDIYLAVDQNHQILFRFFDYRRELSVNVIVDFQTYENRKMVSSRSFALTDVLNGLTLPGIKEEDYNAIKSLYHYKVQNGVIVNEQNREEAQIALSQIIIDNLDSLKLEALK